jgi:acyl-CoA reductase-like NAD-dependent aldehyde dehydrogenase
MMGNTVVWKPASSAVYVAFHIMRAFEEAGLPPGVINFLPGDGPAVGDTLLAHPDLAGIHFTGSTRVFQGLWQTNDKPTGAVVGLQPFGGSRASGTNDKAGSPLNLERWVTPRTIKESFCPPTDYRYPFMDTA